MVEIKEIEIKLREFFSNYNCLNQSNRVEFAYIFGSMARGDNSPVSDIDIAIFFNQSPSLDEELALFCDISKVLKTDKIDLLILNSAKNIILLEEIVREGFLIFESNRERRILFEARIIHQAIDFKSHRKKYLGR